MTASRGLEAAGEADHGGLGGRVREVLGQPEDAGGGGHDDAAVALSHHVWPCGTGGVERPDRVHGEVAGEVVLVGVRNPRPPDDAGVVDEDVEVSESLQGGFDECPRHPLWLPRRCCRQRQLRRRRRSPPRRRPRRPASAPRPSMVPPRSLTTTLAPRAASSRAWARPIPRPAPVTIATRPSKLCQFTPTRPVGAADPRRVPSSGSPSRRPEW